MTLLNVIFKRSYFVIGGNAHKNKVSQLLEVPDGRLISTSFDGMVKSENLLLKFPGATNYWIHGGIILELIFLQFVKLREF